MKVWLRFEGVVKGNKGVLMCGCDKGWRWGLMIMREGGTALLWQEWPSPCVQVGRVPFQVTSGLQVRDGLPVSTYPSSQLKVTEVFTVPDPSMQRWVSPELKEQLAEKVRRTRYDEVTWLQCVVHNESLGHTHDHLWSSRCHLWKQLFLLSI